MLLTASLLQLNFVYLPIYYELYVHLSTFSNIMRSFIPVVATTLVVAVPALAAPHYARQVEYGQGIWAKPPPVNPACQHPTLQNFGKCIGPAIARREEEDARESNARILSTVARTVRSIAER